MGIAANFPDLSSTLIINLLTDLMVITLPLAKEILPEFDLICVLTPEKLIFDANYPPSKGKGKKTQAEPFPLIDYPGMGYACRKIN